MRPPAAARRPPLRPPPGLVAFGAVLVSTLATALFVSAFLKVVPANNVAIPTTFGEIGSPLQSGIHFVNPFTQLHEWTLRLQRHRCSAHRWRRRALRRRC